MKTSLGDQPSEQQDEDHLSISSNSLVQFTDVESGEYPEPSATTPHSSRSKRIVLQPPVTINVFGAGAPSIGGLNTGPAATNITNNPATSSTNDSVISRLESQIAALTGKVDQLAKQVDSMRVQSRLEVDGGRWTTKNIRPASPPQAETHQRINFSKKFESVPKVIVSMYLADVGSDKNFRVNVHATDIDTKGFTVHADSWRDTVFHACGVSWIAVGKVSG